jgi:hypothetical protein
MLFFVILNIGVTFSQAYSLLDSMPIITSDPGLTRTAISGTANWDIVNQSIILGTNGTNMFLLADGRTAGINASFETKVARNYSGYDNAFLRFPIGMGYPEGANFSFKVEYSEDQTNWTLLKEYKESVSQIVVDLKDLIGKTKVYFKFTLNAPNPASNNFIYIDYIRWVELLNDFDANLLAATPSLEYQRIKQNIDVIALVRNDGSQKINSLELSYKLEGESTPRTQLFENLNLEAFGTSILTFDQKITSNTPIKLKVSDFKITKVNSSSNDGITTNNSLTFESNVIFLSKIPTKKVLFEEFTTAACVHCPDGHVVADRMLANNPNVIAVNIHAGFGTDQMTTPQATVLAGRFAQGAPTAMMDRNFYSGEGYAISRNTWESRALTRSGLITPVSIDAKSTYDETSKKLTLSVDVKVFTYLNSKSLRANAYVIQDGMTGTGTGWNQTNAYNNTTGHPMAGRGNPIIGYIHDKVERRLLGGTWGEKWRIKTGPITSTDFEKYTFNFDDVVNEIENASKAHLVVFVSDSGAMGTNDYLVHNALKIGLNEEIISKVVDLSAGSSISNVTINENINLYPNPSNGQFVIDFSSATQQNSTIQIFNLLGMNVYNKEVRINQGVNKVSIDASTLNSGIYFLNIDNQKVKFTIK